MLFYDNRDDTVPVQSHRCLMPIPACIGRKQGEEQNQTDMKKTLCVCHMCYSLQPIWLAWVWTVGGKQSSLEWTLGEYANSTQRGQCRSGATISHQCLKNKADDILYFVTTTPTMCHSVSWYFTFPAHLWLSALRALVSIQAIPEVAWRPPSSLLFYNLHFCH